VLTPLALASCLGLLVIGGLAWRASRWVGQMDQAGAADLWHGDDAKRKIVEYKNMTNVSDAALVVVNDETFVFDGGTFNGVILYWSFQCASIDDCWKCVLSGGNLQRSDFTQFEPLSVVPLKGPQQYDARVSSSMWRLQDVKDGMHYKRQQEDRRILYIAIDYKTATVFGCYQSGGF
jgi:hypothetical protein